MCSIYVWYTLHTYVQRGCLFLYAMYIMFPYVLNACSHMQRTYTIPHLEASGVY